MQNNELNCFSIYGDRYIKTNYGNKVYNDFCGLSVSENGVQWESFTIISIGSLRVYETKY